MKIGIIISIKNYIILLNINLYKRKTILFFFSFEYDNKAYNPKIQYIKYLKLKTSKSKIKFIIKEQNDFYK